MPKKRDIVRVSTRAPRFREDTVLMKAHETMVDFIKGGGPSGSFMDILGAAGIFGLMQHVDVVPERDLIYSDDEDEDENFNEPNHTPELQPHPQLKEIDDEEAEQIKESLEEEQKRKSKSVKNKRKKMRKKEKKRQEKEEGDLNASPEEEQGNSSENEDLNNEETNTEQNNIDNYKEIDKSTPSLSDIAITEEKNCKLIKKKAVILNKEKDKPPENIERKNSKPSITESVPEKKSKNKSKKIEKAQISQNNKVENVKLPEKEFKVDKPVKVETKENTEIKQEEKEGENKEESMDSMVEEYAKKSKEMAAMGNNFAANGQYEMAIKWFTEAIKFNPREYKLFGNRSFCFEKMQRFEEALSDAEVSLSMEPNWIKGLFRKGKALCGLMKYYEASLAYRDVLSLDSTSQEAAVELKRAQTLHLMEMGFTWTQSSNALKRHSSLEEAVEALFNEERNFSPEENGACQLDMLQLSRAGHSVLNKEWKDVQSPTKYKPQIKEKVQPQPPVSKKQGKMELFPVWVGSLAPTVNYMTLQEVFSRAGKVLSIKMVLEHHCAFVNYTRKEDSAQAIRLLNGLVLEGCPLAVRYPSRIPPGIGVSKDALTDPHTPPSVEKECFFWRTIGCTRDDCTFNHIPQNKGIDRGRFSSKLAHHY